MSGASSLDCCSWYACISQVWQGLRVHATSSSGDPQRLLWAVNHVQHLISFVMCAPGSAFACSQRQRPAGRCHLLWRTTGTPASSQLERVAAAAIANYALYLCLPRSSKQLLHQNRLLILCLTYHDLLDGRSRVVGRKGRSRRRRCRCSRWSSCRKACLHTCTHLQDETITE